jgi:hypothetical protein
MAEMNTETSLRFSSLFIPPEIFLLGFAPESADDRLKIG